MTPLLTLDVNTNQHPFDFSTTFNFAHQLTKSSEIYLSPLIHISYLRQMQKAHMVAHAVKRYTAKVKILIKLVLSRFFQICAMSLTGLSEKKDPHHMVRLK